MSEGEIVAERHEPWPAASSDSAARFPPVTGNSGQFGPQQQLGPQQQFGPVPQFGPAAQREPAAQFGPVPQFGQFAAPPAHPAFRPPSGLFPGLPPRPVYREPHPVRAAALMSGLGAGLVWLALFGAIGQNLISYACWTVVAAVTAWIVALVLSVIGDRGVAVGVALAGGFGLAVAVAFVAGRWISTYPWPLY